MSIPFTNLTGKDADQAGYFRIGHVVLRNPPTDILTNRVSGKERVTVIRGTNDLVKFNGKGRWDVTVRWVSMLDDTAEGDHKYDQWEDLRSIIAIFKAAPFVEVENSYIRQILCDEDPTLGSYIRMGFGLRQLRISTHPDIIDAFDCSLSMTWFNYFPYTNDFSYIGDQGQPTDADQSSLFSNYIESWKKQYLDSARTTDADKFNSDVPTANWKDQIPGSVTISWREYKSLKYDTLVVVKNSNPESSTAITALDNANKTVTGINKSDIVPSGSYDALIQKYAKADGISPAMAKAIMMQESGGKPNSVGSNLRFIKGSKTTYKSTTAGNTPNSVSAYLLQHIQNDSDGGAAVVATYISQNGTGPDLGLMQLHYPGTATQYIRGARPVDCLNPEVSIKAGCDYLKHLYSQGMTDQQIYAYNTGSPSSIDKMNPLYAQQVLSKRDQYAIMSTVSSTQPNLAAAPKPKVSKPVAVTPTVSNSSVISSSPDGTENTATINAIIQEQADNDWIFDHRTNDMMYFYQPHNIKLVDEEHMDSVVQLPGSPKIDLSPRSISILLVNNLAQVPLASYLYPTYQHVGSPSSQVSIGFTSVGTYNTPDSAPSHVGVSILGGVASILDNQYLYYRSNHRNRDSIQRMQAVYIENQVLNMLGIRGLSIDNLATETIPETANEVQFELTMSQYENIFESTDSFRINNISAQATSITQNIVNSGQLANLSPAEQQQIPTLYNFAKGRWTSDISILSSYLLQEGAISPTPPIQPFASFNNLPAINPSASQIASMLAIVTVPNNPSKWTTPVTNAISIINLNNVTDAAISINSNYPSIVGRLNSVHSSGKWTIGDACLVYAAADELLSNPPIPSLEVSATTAGLTAAKTAAYSFMQNNSAGIQAVYDKLFPMLTSDDSKFALDVNSTVESSAFMKQYATGGIDKNPALTDWNNDGTHVAYKGMMPNGSNKLIPGVTSSPGSYFFDYSSIRREAFTDEIEKVLSSSNSTNSINSNAAGFSNKANNSSEYDINFPDPLYINSGASVASITKLTNIPGLTMSEAFPTFKLFLMEDEADGLMSCNDNFYSYASVTEMEVIRYRDQPDVAVIQITNINNILLNTLYDNTLMGRYNYGMKGYHNNEPSEEESADRIAGRTIAGGNYDLDLSDGMELNKRARMPLQYIALQPGTKIQIRMGYDNNPDLLTPVFTGRVTKIDTEGDMLVITTESFLGELCDLPVMNGMPLAAKNWGNSAHNWDSGDTSSVIANLLKTDTAKHFGRLKLDAKNPNQLLTGFTWVNRLGKAVGAFQLNPNNTLSYVGAGLTYSFDRSEENILINHLTSYEGTPSQTRVTNNAKSDLPVRSWADTGEKGFWMFPKFSYSTVENSTFTTWDLIKDVARRYPGFNVCCKQYGFPFSADATLVMAHPLDWYYARPGLLGDAETFQNSTEAKQEWTDWWNNGGGKGLWEHMITTVVEEMTPVAARAVGVGYINTAYVRSIVGTPTDPGSMNSGLESLRLALQTFSGMPVAGNTNASQLATLMYGLDVGVQKLSTGLWTAIDLATGAGNYASQVSAKNDAIRGELLAVQRSFQNFVELKNNQSYSLLKPVRRYHFIDYNSIIHNSMSLSSNIYNTIRVKDADICANNNIPSYFRRELDVTNLINDPKENLNTDAIKRNIGQSYLRDELGKMYSGEIVLRGTPEIEPFDCLIILDPSTAIAGVVEVDKVIHSFTIETGYITIVYPRAIVACNEAASAGVTRMLAMIFAKSLHSLDGVSNLWNDTGKTGKTIVAGTSVATVAVAATAVSLAGPSLGVCVALASALAFGGALVIGYGDETANSVLIFPITRHGRPWVGGLEGYKITDLWSNLASGLNGWIAEDIYPLIDMYRTATGEQGTPVPGN